MKIEAESHQITGEVEIMLYKVKFSKWYRFIRIILGTGLLAFSVKCVYDPCGLVIGGFSGIAIIVRKLTHPFIDGGIPLGVTTFVLNIPFFIISWFKMGKAFVKRTFVATVFLSLWLMILPQYSLTGNDYMLTAIAGGVTGGAGIGLVLSVGTTTGGTDMVATLLQKKIPYISVAQIMVVVDAAIVLASSGLFGVFSIIYAGISLFIQGKVSDGIVLGTHFAKSVFIITDKPKEISYAVLKDLNRGMTSMEVMGEYTGKNKRMLFCVVSKKEIIKLKDIVNQYDNKAFVIVSEAKEVLGEGF